MKSETVVQSLAALAQGTRLAVYRLLVQHGPSGLAAGEIAAQLNLAPATLSFHLKELSHAGLIRPRQEGRFIFYAADFGAMAALVAFLTENCCAADGTSCAPSAGCRPTVTQGARSSRIARKQGVKS